MAPRKESSASSAPVSTSTEIPVTSRMVSSTSSVFTIFRTEAVPNTYRSEIWKLSSRALKPAITRQATKMPLSESVPPRIYSARPAHLLLVEQAFELLPLILINGQADSVGAHIHNTTFQSGKSPLFLASSTYSIPALLWGQEALQDLYQKIIRCFQRGGPVAISARLSPSTVKKAASRANWSVLRPRES